MQKIFLFLKHFGQFFRGLFSEFSISFLKQSSSYAYQNIVRNPIISFSSVLIITLVLVLFHVTLALNFFAGESITALNKKVDMIIELQEGVDIYKIEPLIERLESYSEIEAVSFVDKKDALDDFLERHVSIKNFLEKYKLENPLPSTIEVRALDLNGLKEAQKVFQEAKYEDLIIQSKIEADTEQKDRINKIINLGEFIESMSTWFLIIFITVSILIIFNTVNVAIHNRRDEIHTMELVGATKTFIQAPFVLEGIFYSCIALLLATAINLFLHFYILGVVAETISNSALLEGITVVLSSFFLEYPSVIFFEACLLLVCSILASFIAIEVYLRKHHI